MKVAFRVDASSQIGTGHFMRCLTLADALQQRGVGCRFVSRHQPGHLRDLLAAKGHEFVAFDNVQDIADEDELAHSGWLGTSQMQDALDTIKSLSDTRWDWLVVDHYALDVRWESVLRRSAGKILAIDDIADRQHDCDVLLDQNYYVDSETRYVGKVPEHCQLLLGPRYALLRDEFRQQRKQARPRTGPVKRILVFFGGVDVGNYTMLAIEALAGIGAGGLQVDVVIGAQHPHRQDIEIACRDQGFICHVQANRMAELMAAADLAIGAAGGANWERCCLGLPCLVGAVARNQEQAAKDIAALGAARFIGSAQEITAQNLREEIKRAIASGWIIKASLACFDLVDALGTDRVIKAMETI